MCFSKGINDISDANNMEPVLQPNVLKQLTFVEEYLITQVHFIIMVYCLKGDQFGHSEQL